MIDQYIYTIRRKSDGALVAQGTAEQCAKDLGICLATFYRRRWRKIGGYDAYEVIAPTRSAPHPRRKRQMVYTIFRAGTDDVVVTGTAKWRKIGGYDAYEVIAPTRSAPHPRRKRQMVYTIFRAGTDDVVVTGTAKQCAAALGMKLTSFHTTLGHITEGTYHKYDFQRKQCAAALGMKLTSFHTTLGHITEGTYHKYDFQREGYYDVE